MLKKGHLAQTPKNKKGTGLWQDGQPLQISHMDPCVSIQVDETQESRFLEDSALLSPVLV